MQHQNSLLVPVAYPDGMIESIIDYFIEVATRDVSYFSNLLHPQKSFQGRLFFKLLIGNKAMPSADALDALFVSPDAQLLTLAFGQRATRIQPGINTEVAKECKSLVDEFFQPICKHSKWQEFITEIKSSISDQENLQRLQVKLAGLLGHKFLSTLEALIKTEIIICELSAHELLILNKIILGFVITHELKHEVTFHQQKQKLQNAILYKLNLDLLSKLITKKDKHAITLEIQRLKTEIIKLHDSDEFRALGRDGCTLLIMQLHASFNAILDMDGSSAKHAATKEFATIILDYLSSHHNETALLELRHSAGKIIAANNTDKFEELNSEMMSAKSLLLVIKQLYERAYPYAADLESYKTYKKLLDISPIKDPVPPTTPSPRMLLLSPRAASDSVMSTNSPRTPRTSPLRGGSSPRVTESPRITLNPGIARSPSPIPNRYMLLNRDKTAAADTDKDTATKTIKP